ncbi:MAG: hypothetical protein WC295_05250 [Methanoregula sp.]
MMKTVLIATLLLIVGGMLVAPVSAATTWINTSKYADNNYSSVVNWANLTYQEMNATLPKAYSNGPVYMQGPTFDPADPYGTAGQNMINFYGHNGTYVRNLTDLAGGMAAGDELKIQSSDSFAVYFGADDVNTPEAHQGNLVVSWWDSDMGLVPGYYYGMRLFFYNPQSTYGFNDDLNLTLVEMRDNFDPWYRSNYTNIDGTWPSAKGLSSKYVQYLKIYPPHRHDFNTTGDTTGAAFMYQTSGLPTTPDDPSDAFATTSAIADDDGTFKSDVTDTEECYAAHRFNFSIDTSTTKDGPIADIEKLNVTWNGKGWHDTPGNNGTDLYIYDFTASSYGSALASTSYGTEQTLTGEITSGISNYVNSGNVTVLVKQKSPHNEFDEASHLSTDYVKLVVTHHHSN